MARAENTEKYIDQLIHEGSKIPLRVTKLSAPSWYDDEKFRRGQQFIRENYFFVSSSTLFVVFMVLLEVKIHKEFSETGQFQKTSDAIRHHYKMFVKIRSWYSGSIYEKKSKSHNTLYIARTAHVRNSAKLIDGQIGITQKDMAAGIYAFMAIIMSEYDHFYTQSANELEKQKFEGYLHFWRVIAYHNGQMDEFNLCDGSPSEVRKRCENIFQIIYKPILDKAPRNNGNMFKEVLALVKCWCYLIDKDGLIEFARRKHKLPQSNLTTVKSRIFVPIMLFLHEKILKTWWISPIARPILNLLARAAEHLILVTVKLLGLMRLIRKVHSLS